MNNTQQLKLAHNRMSSLLTYIEALEQSFPTTKDSSVAHEHINNYKREYENLLDVVKPNPIRKFINKISDIIIP